MKGLNLDKAFILRLAFVKIFLRCLVTYQDQAPFVHFFFWKRSQFQRHFKKHTLRHILYFITTIWFIIRCISAKTNTIVGFFVNFISALNSLLWVLRFSSILVTIDIMQPHELEQRRIMIPVKHLRCTRK